jgi:hypothetical protein
MLVTVHRADEHKSVWWCLQRSYKRAYSSTPTENKFRFCGSIAIPLSGNRPFLEREKKINSLVMSELLKSNNITWPIWELVQPSTQQLNFGALKYDEPKENRKEMLKRHTCCTNPSSLQLSKHVSYLVQLLICGPFHDGTQFAWCSLHHPP